MEEEGSLGFMMVGRAWPHELRGRGVLGGHSPRRLPLVRRAGPQAGAGVTFLLHSMAWAPLRKPQGGRVRDDSPI